MRFQFFLSLRAQKKTLPNDHLLDAGAGTGGNVEHSAIRILGAKIENGPIILFASHPICPIAATSSRFPPHTPFFILVNCQRVNVHCSKGVSEGFLYKVLGFPRVPWVSCTVASVFEPESKARVVFLRCFPRVSHGFPKGFPGFLRFPPRYE